MAKRLSLEQIEQMKVLVQKGMAPEDIARTFNVAVSSVHNYKAKFKAEGVAFPVVRGKRPVHSKLEAAELKQVTGVVNTPTDNNFKFIVNGVSVQVSAQAKSVNIDKNTMEIKF